MLFLSCLTLSCQAFATSAAGDCVINNGNAIVVWTAFDDINGYIHVYGATGTVSQNSSNWTSQELSIDTNGSYYVTQPRLAICEATGDAVAIWQYYDDNTGLLRVGAATLPAGTSTWSNHLVSDSLNQQGLSSFDGQAFVDANGNVLITWSAYDQNNSDYDVLAATAVISGTTTTWGNSFVLPGGTAPLATRKTMQNNNKPSKGPKLAPPNPMKERCPPVKMGKRK